MRIPVKTLAAVVSVSAVGVAGATDPAYISVPTPIQAGQPVVVSGGGFSGKSTVVIGLKVPAGVEFVDPVSVSKDGSISHKVALTQPGTYVAKVYDVDGNLLASTVIVAGGTSFFKQ
jgi:hypothetical protein